MKPIRTPATTEVIVGPIGSSNVDPLPVWHQVDDTTGALQICSVWQPSPEERQAIADGANLVVVVWMARVPPMAIVVPEATNPDFQPVPRPLGPAPADLPAEPDPA